jgi:hypothetical protein
MLHHSNAFQHYQGDSVYSQRMASVYYSSLLNVKPMPLLTILIVLIVVGFILWLINTYIPMDRKIKNILNVVVVILVVIWLLRVFGLIDSITNVRI